MCDIHVNLVETNKKKTDVPNFIDFFFQDKYNSIFSSTGRQHKTYEMYIDRGRCQFFSSRYDRKYLYFFLEDMRYTQYMMSK